MASSLLAALLQDWRLLLTQWARNGTLSRAALEALRLSEEPEALRLLVSRWSAGDLLDLPPVVVLPASAMPTAAGAYAITTGTIYLNQAWLQSSSRERVLQVLTEELGHHLDGLLNVVDTPGDEGELFAILAKGVALRHEELQRIQKEDDLAAVRIKGMPIETEQAATIFASLLNPVGITIDTQGNLITNSDGSRNLVLSKFSADGSLLKQAEYRTSLSGDLGYLSPVTKQGKIFQLQSDGDLIAIDPVSLSMTQYANLRQLSTDVSTIVDIASGLIGSLGGLIVPEAPNTLYGDIAIYERGNWQDIFISGLSMGTFPFVMRLRFLSGSLQSSKVLVASVATTAGDINLTRGVAVNNQGIVLTTLPIATGRIRPQFIDVPVSFSADFPEGNGERPQERFEGQGDDFSDGSNHLVIPSQGITTDSTGNFYIVTNSIGAPGLGAPGKPSLFVVLNSDLTSVLDVQSANIGASYRDVAVSPDGDQAFVTSSEGKVLGFPVSVSTTTFEIAATSGSVQAEGNSGTTNFLFTITRKGDSTGTNTVTVSLDGTGSNPADALDFLFGSSLPQTSILNFADGETTKELSVAVKGDTTTEQNELFSVNLSNATGGATIATGKAIGNILNDDITDNNDNFINRRALAGRIYRVLDRI
jgi:hypothetical protein